MDVADRDCLEFRAGDYLENVRAEITKLRTQHPSAQHVACGLPLHPETYRRKLHTYVALDDDGFQEASASICGALFRIHSLTGMLLPTTVTSNEAYRRAPSIEPIPGSRLQRITFDPDAALWVDRQSFLHALAILDGMDPTRYQPGCRYFFGHLVPD